MRSAFIVLGILSLLLGSALAAHSGDNYEAFGVHSTRYSLSSALVEAVIRSVQVTINTAIDGWRLVVELLSGCLEYIPFRRHLPSQPSPVFHEDHGPYIFRVSPKYQMYSEIAPLKFPKRLFWFDNAVALCPPALELLYGPRVEPPTPVIEQQVLDVPSPGSTPPSYGIAFGDVLGAVVSWIDMLKLYLSGAEQPSYLEVSSISLCLHFVLAVIALGVVTISAVCLYLKAQSAHEAKIDIAIEQLLMGEEDNLSRGRQAQEYTDAVVYVQSLWRRRQAQCVLESERQRKEAVRNAAVLLQSLCRRRQAQALLLFKLKEEKAKEEKLKQDLLSLKLKEERAKEEKLKEEKLKEESRLIEEKATAQERVLSARLLQGLWRKKEYTQRLQNLVRADRTVTRKIYQYQAELGVGLREVTVPDDGNCLFYSLSFAEYGTIEKHSEIRRQICDWLESNPNFEIFGLPICLTEDLPWDEYVKEMRKDKAYGTSSCIRAASEIFKANIHIIKAEGPDEEFRPPKNEQGEIINEVKSVYRIVYKNTHYNPVKTTTDGSFKTQNIPAETPKGMKECRFCTRWKDDDNSPCRRCGTV